MDLTKIVAEIDSQIARLQQARAELAGSVNGTGKKSARRGARKMSPAARRRIAAATKARWAKARKAGKRSL